MHQIFFLPPTDTYFTDSPSTCDPACLCSHCGQIIHAGQNIVRGWTDETPRREYRYHARCLGFKSRDELACDCFDETRGSANVR